MSQKFNQLILKILEHPLINIKRLEKAKKYTPDGHKLLVYTEEMLLIHILFLFNSKKLNSLLDINKVYIKDSIDLGTNDARDITQSYVFSYLKLYKINANFTMAFNIHDLNTHPDHILFIPLYSGEKKQISEPSISIGNKQIIIEIEGKSYKFNLKYRKFHEEI